ncbi:hypothetical protein [Bacteroides xylanisolvens]|uniref:hypothetical protein n=1 Tax=Bacteroides xylanisolvens TaxID=371601 RepID=UPI0015A5B205|nr:hypothetical protein [Bacteroides xylanisolvens]
MALYAGFHNQIRPRRGGDFVVNCQAQTLHTRKTWQVPLRHNSHQVARKWISELCEEKVSRKRVMICKKGLQPKEKIQKGIPEKESIIPETFVSEAQGGSR